MGTMSNQRAGVLPTPEVNVADTVSGICDLAAAEILRALADAQSRSGSASLVLTGGRTGTAVLERMRDHEAGRLVDWSRVDFYWGDDRFVPAEHPDRNELQARRALLDHLPLDPERIHPMPASDGVHGTDLDAAAATYRALIHAAARRGFDVCMLGVGEDGHVASLFPGRSGAAERELPVITVHESPKPPPMRISLTLPVIRRCAEVHLLATGAAKASAVAAALEEGANGSTPAAQARGVARTAWFLDSDAAREL